MDYELEDDLELESEFEDEFELEDEFEDEWEDELEGELEDEFEDEFELEGEFEDEYEDEDEQFWGALASIAGKALPSLIGGLFEDEADYHQLTPQQANSLMEQVAERAAEAESEDEAEAFLGALVPLAMKALPAIASAAPSIIKAGSKLFRKAAPKIIRKASVVGRRLMPQVMRAGRLMWRNPHTRRYVRALPGVIRQTTRQLVRRRGYPGRYTPRHVRAAWQRNVRQTLASRRRRLAMLRRHQMLKNRTRGFRRPMGGTRKPAQYPRHPQMRYRCRWTRY